NYAQRAVQVAAAVLAMRDGLVHPTINLDQPDPQCDLDYVPHAARPARVDVALCNCIAFGSKNSALPILAACLMAEGKTTLKGVPRRSDIDSMYKLLGELGVRHHRHEATSDERVPDGPPLNGDLDLEVINEKVCEARYDIVKTMRASICVLGPLLAKRGTISATTLRARPLAEKAKIVRGVREQVWPLVDAGAIRPIIDRSMPMSAAAEAHRLVEAANDAGGKDNITVVLFRLGDDVIHAGAYYAPGSLKARLCVGGAARMYEFCEQRGVDVDRIGKLIVALHDRELPALDEIERRASANGVQGLRRLDAGGLREIEPHATGIAALHSPNTGIVDFGVVCARLAEDVRAAGGELRTDWEVAGVDAGARSIRLRAAGGDEAEGARAIFCAGLWSDRLAVLAGAGPDPRIVPFRGGYLRLAPQRRELVRGLIYPVPDPSLPFLGVHLTPRIDGEVLLGPSALLVGARDGYDLSRLRAADIRDTLTWPGTWRMIARWWRTGIGELRLAASRAAFAAEASRYVPAVRSEDLLPAFGGVRAQAVARDGRLLDDFLVSATPRAIHVRNAPSPAATSALALAGLIADAADELA
ncbi:MAG: L-2-hydroxyglutarate oxidase, partial [Actinobacteria bacterium]|nr:L-2-hydroxyglutarate oxidase [Actinomycetota bacterium]